MNQIANPPIRLPFYAKTSLLIVGMFFLISMLSIGEDILLPLIYAGIIAILVSPMISFLERHGWNRVLAIACVLVFVILMLIALVALLFSRISVFTDAFPALLDKFKELITQVVSWISDNLNIRERDINSRMTNAYKELFSSNNELIGSTLASMGGLIATIFLTPVYIFMFLFYQPHIIRSIHEIFGSVNDGRVTEVLTETKSIVQSYLIGLIIEMVIVAILNSIGLMVLGMEYAILLGVLGALLNIIPYLGGLIGVSIYMIIALVTKSSEYVLYVVALYSVIQFIDNNYLVPRIVGSKVKLNALVSIVAVIAGAALWGIPGMFLSIPLTAIIKLILDRMESTKPWGLLLGDTMPPIIKLRLSDVIKSRETK